MTVDQLLRELIGSSERAVGSAATIRACQRQSLDLVLLARDAAPDIVESVSDAAVRSGTRLISVPTRSHLAMMAGERRPTSAIGVRRLSDNTLSLFAQETLAWARDLLLWFQSKRFTHLEGGYKTATLRVGLRRPGSFRLGIVETETGSIKGIASIDQVSWLRWRDVPSRSDILVREYPSEWTQLEQEMTASYPSLAPDTWVTYYGFRYESVPL